MAALALLEIAKIKEKESADVADDADEDPAS
jgi:hypothetical protein